jgi:hypothetical protein
MIVKSIRGGGLVAARGHKHWSHYAQWLVTWMACQSILRVAVSTHYKQNAANAVDKSRRATPLGSHLDLLGTVP